MTRGKKLFAALLALIMLASALVFSGAMAENAGAEPHGDGNGIVPRPLLAALYKWMSDMDDSFFRLLTFDDICAAMGKAGCVKPKDGDTYHAAYWTDGNVTVTVTFKNRDGYWGVGSITTGMSKDEYGVADTSFLPHVGNREAGSSATAPVTLTTEVKSTREKVTVTADVPTEYWFPQVSFGEARYLNAASEDKASGNSSGLRISFWPDEATLQADLNAGDNLTETESLYLLGMVMPGYTYTRYGMNMTDYVARLADNLWMRISLYKMTVYDGSEAEAIIRSLQIEKGDFSFSYQPLSCDVGDDGASFLDVVKDSGAVQEGILYVTEKDDAAYVNNNYDAAFLSFSHDLESDNYYSYADFDVVVLNPGTADERPILRLWISLWTGGQAVREDSVTFTTGEKSYTFTELSDPDDFKQDGEDYKQTMLIRFDQDSLPFLVDLDWNHLLLGEQSIRVVFHGTEEIATELSDHFYDVFSAYWTLYYGADAENCLDGYHANPMRTEE